VVATAPVLFFGRENLRLSVLEERQHQQQSSHTQNGGEEKVEQHGGKVCAQPYPDVMKLSKLLAPGFSRN
jgi:hypothetical protein